MHSKKLLVSGAILLLVSLAWQYQSRPSETKLPPIAKLTPEPSQKAMRESLPQVLTQEERIERLKSFYKKLGAIKEQDSTKADIQDLTRAPQRKLITAQKGIELIEITYADGGKTYLPHTERFDVNQNIILPKEF